MPERKPYAKPVVRSVSRQEFCAHCIDQRPVGRFSYQDGEFDLCPTCATFLHKTSHKLLPPIVETGVGLSLINTATRIPSLDDLDVQMCTKGVRREWLRRDYEG